MVTCIRQCYPPSPCHPLPPPCPHIHSISVSLIPALQLGSSVPFFSRFHRFPLLFIARVEAFKHMAHSGKEIPSPSPGAVENGLVSRSAESTGQQHALHPLLVPCWNSFSAGQKTPILTASEKNSMSFYVCIFLE